MSLPEWMSLLSNEVEALIVLGVSRALLENRRCYRWCGVRRGVLHEGEPVLQSVFQQEKLKADHSTLRASSSRHGSMITRKGEEE